MIEHIVEYQTPIRLDRFLKHQYPLLTQGVIQKALRKSLVRVAGKVVHDASLRLQQGDVVKIAEIFSQYNQQENKTFSHSLQMLARKILQEYLIFEHNEFIVINKPEKIASQGGTGVNISIADALVFLNQEQGSGFRIVHRLDKHTSGVMVIAKNYDAAVKLSQAFREHKIHKTYRAMLLGKISKQNGTITVDDEITKFKVLEYLPNDDFTYIELYPITGKEHQLRRHALELGSSVVGDKRYGPAECKSQHMLLHALNLKIEQEVFSQQLSFTAELPNYFNV